MIKFDQVCKDYCHGDKVALDHVDFEIQDGEFVFVTGHSGCGKTTLLRLLMRELKPSSGAVYYNGQNLKRLSRRKVARHRRDVGVVFQDYRLIDDLNVRENIALPLIIAHERRREINQRISELLELLGLQTYEKVFPSQLSGGEAQRVGLARALITAPHVIFADEPTGNLDAANAREILNLLVSVNSYGTTVIMATHDLDLISLVPNARHIQLEHGRVVGDNGCQLGADTAHEHSCEEEPTADQQKDIDQSTKKPSQQSPDATSKEQSADEQNQKESS